MFIKDIEKTIKATDDILHSNKWLDAFADADKKKTVKVKCSEINIESWIKEHVIYTNDPHAFVRCSEIKEVLFVQHPNCIGENKLYAILHEIEGYCKRKKIQSKVETNVIMNHKLVKVSS